MLYDGLHIPSNQVIRANVCILGCGPAGLIIADQLAKASISVLLLESGGLKHDSKLECLNINQIHDHEDLSLAAPMRRQAGGNSHLWKLEFRRRNKWDWEQGLRYMPLDDIDFESRDWVANSGWPLSMSELIPFYKQAELLTKCIRFHYSETDWLHSSQAAIASHSNDFLAKYFGFGSRDLFRRDLLDRCIRSKHVSLYTHATGTQLITNSSGDRIERVKISNLSGNVFWVEAKKFILAMGGIQTPRLLLASNKSSQSISIGNEHEMVGRYLMDHPLIDIGRLRVDGSATFNATEFYDLRCINHRSLMGHLAVSRSAMKRYHLLNNSILLYPRPEPTAVQAVQTIQAMRSHKAWQKSWPHLLRSLNEIGRLAIKEYNYIGRSIYLSMKHDQVAVPSLDRGGWSELPEAYDRFNYFRLVMLTEQAPNPSNRIILNHERDPLGIPGVDIYWNTSDLDLESAHQTLALLSQAVDKSGLGFVEPYYRNGSPFFHGHSTHHHMGATRMSWSPREGVVDHNCRVHSCANLFIASSSVFPTGGYANPTFTIIALSLRLADHIKKMIGSDSLWLA